MGTPLTPPLSSDGGGYAAARRTALEYLLQKHRDLLIHPGAREADTSRAIEEAVAECGAEAYKDRLAREPPDSVAAGDSVEQHDRVAGCRTWRFAALCDILK